MSERRHIPALDGVRGIAIAAVVALHLSLPLGQAGSLGVEVFFVLSGFLITGILTAEHATTGRVWFGGFYLRRVLRLYPALLLTVALAYPVFVLIRPRQEGAGAWASGALIAVTYTTDIAQHVGWGSVFPLGHTWSLAVEEQFYLLWPLLLVVGLRRHWSVRLLTGVALAGVAASLLLLEVYYRPTGGDFPPAVYNNALCHVGGLFVGCALALNPRHHARVTARITTGATAALVVLIAASPSIGGGPHQWAYFRLSMPATWLLTAVILAGAAARAGGAGVRVLSWWPLRELGLISYGLYLLHPLVLAVVDRYVHSGRSVTAPVTLIASLAVAEASFRLYERRFLRLKPHRSQVAAADPARRQLPPEPSRLSPFPQPRVPS